MLEKWRVLSTISLQKSIKCDIIANRQVEEDLMPFLVYAFILVLVITSSAVAGECKINIMAATQSPCLSVNLLMKEQVPPHIVETMSFETVRVTAMPLLPQPDTAVRKAAVE